MNNPKKIALCSCISAISMMVSALSYGEENEISLEEVVVTGTPGGASVSKVDASFSITTANADDIKKFAPKSTADLLKIVPGVWAESSSGVAGANVFVRGFPGGGDAPYLTIQLNGSPIFPPPTLSFLENTTLFRVDETIERVEALRGGPNPVLSNGQPGLTTNFILRKGGEETEGFVKYTTADYDLNRLDGYVSGEISPDFYYMIGGYIESSTGIRDAGFNAREGQQFTISLDRDFDNGTVNIYHRATEDHGVWYLPGALNAPAADDNTYTQIGTLNRQRDIIYGAENETRNIDLGDGRGWDGSVTGGSFEFELSNGWIFSDRYSVTHGNADTLGLVPNGSAVRVGDLLATPDIDASAVVTGDLSRQYSGTAVGNDEYIQQFGAWEVRKDIESFVNDLSLSKSFNDLDITLGYYNANASTDEFWSLGNHKYHVVESGGEIVSGIACNETSVDSCGWNYDINATGDSRSSATYFAAAYNFTDALTADFGIRNESHEVDYSVDEGLDGTISKAVRYSTSQTAWTAAVNYALNDYSGVFVRLNKGSKLPYFDDFRDQFGQYSSGNDLIQEVEQSEIGYKLANSSFQLYATLFNTKVDPSVFVALSGVTTPDIATNKSYGVEIDSSYNVGNFNVNLNATFQETEIEGGDNDGNEAQRQPGWQLRITPSYDISVGSNSTLSLYGTLSAVDDRFGDNGNTVVLAGYEKVDFGALLTVDDSLTFQLAADNITDEKGLTEGDPRNVDSPNGRFILPASVKFSVGYQF